MIEKTLFGGPGHDLNENGFRPASGEITIISESEVAALHPAARQTPDASSNIAGPDKTPTLEEAH